MQGSVSTHPLVLLWLTQEARAQHPLFRDEHSQATRGTSGLPVSPPKVRWPFEFPGFLHIREGVQKTSYRGMWGLKFHATWERYLFYFAQRHHLC